MSPEQDNCVRAPGNPQNKERSFHQIKIRRIKITQFVLCARLALYPDHVIEGFQNSVDILF